MMRSTLVTLLVAGLLAACGTQGDIIGGVTAWPVAGIQPWAKIDLDAKTSGLQPFVFIADGSYDYVEPTLVKAHGEFWIFFERRHYALEDGVRVPTGSDILAGHASDALSYDWINDGEPVLIADRPWEGAYVGAPTVVETDEGFAMWYAGGEGEGIGYATSEDGVNWSKANEPVIVGDMAWEDGFVGAPGVIVYGGKLRMFYSGGQTDRTPFSQFAGRFIGYADSEDGRRWIKRDAHGRNSRDDGDAVFYILGASQDWQGEERNGTYYGSVASPAALVHRPVDRDLLLVYYTGNHFGDSVNSETSIGVAGAYDSMLALEDGKTPETNPILSERFALSLEGVSEFLAYSESAPSVVRLEYDQYIMAFSQTDALSEVTGGRQGIALAACPRYE